MAGGFSNSDPLDVVKTFAAWDDARYKRGTDMADRRRTFLDEEATKLQGMTGQLNLAIQQGVLTAMKAQLGPNATDKDADDAFQKLDDGSKRKLTEQVFLSRGKEFAPMLDSIARNVHTQRGWAKQFGEDVEFEKIAVGGVPVPKKDANGQPILDENGQPVVDKVPAFGIVMKDKKTGEPRTIPHAMDATDLLTNIVGLGEQAVASRGGRMASTAGLEEANKTSIHNQSVNNALAAGEAANEGAANGLRSLWNTGSTTIAEFGAAPDKPTPATGTASASTGTGTGQGLRQPPAAETQIPYAAAANATTAPTEAPSLLGRALDTVRDVTKGAAAATGAVVAYPGHAASEALQPATLRNIERAIKEGKQPNSGDLDRFATNTWSEAGVDTALTSAASAFGDPGLARTPKERRAALEREVDALKPTREAKKAIMDRFDAQNRAATPMTEKGYALGQEIANDPVVGPRVNAAVAAVQNGTGTEGDIIKALQGTKYYRNNFSADAIKSVLNGALRAKAAGEMRKPLTPREQAVVGLSLAMGWSKPEDWQAAQQAGKAVGDEASKNAMAALARTNTGAVDVNLSGYATNMQAQTARQEAQANLVAKLYGTDKESSEKLITRMNSLIDGRYAGQENAGKRELLHRIMAQSLTEFNKVGVRLDSDQALIRAVNWADDAMNEANAQANGTLFNGTVDWRAVNTGPILARMVQKHNEERTSRGELVQQPTSRPAYDGARGDMPAFASALRAGKLPPDINAEIQRLDAAASSGAMSQDEFKAQMARLAVQAGFVAK